MACRTDLSLQFVHCGRRNCVCARERGVNLVVLTEDSFIRQENRGGHQDIRLLYFYHHR